MLGLVLVLALAQQSGVPSRAGSSSGSASVSPYAPPGYNTGQLQVCILPIQGVNGYQSTPAEWGTVYTSNNSSGAGPSPTLGDVRSISGRGVASTSPTVDTRAGWYTNYTYVARGSSAYVGGFSFWQRIAKITPDFNRMASWFAGLGNYISNPGTCIRPSLVYQDGMAFMCEDGGMGASDTVHFCSWNDGGRTCADLGTDFPCGRHALPDAGLSMFYDLLITAPPGTNSVGYWGKNLHSGAESSGSVTQNLPNADVLLGWRYEICNGDAGTQNIELMAACWNDYSLPNSGYVAADGGSVALDSGLLAYYAMTDGGTSATGLYHAQNANDGGSFSLDAGFIGFGYNASALRGSRGLAVTAGPSFTAGTPWSVSMWVQSTEAGDGGYRVLFQTSATGYGVYMLDGGQVVTWVSSPRPVSPRLGLSVGQWTHLVFAHNGTYTRVYVNGTLWGATSISYEQAINEFANSFGATQPLGGFMDEVGVWIRELTPNEARALFNSGAGNPYPF